MSDQLDGAELEVAVAREVMGHEHVWVEWGACWYTHLEYGRCPFDPLLVSGAMRLNAVKQRLWREGMIVATEVFPYRADARVLLPPDYYLGECFGASVPIAVKAGPLRAEATALLRAALKAVRGRKERDDA